MNKRLFNCVMNETIEGEGGANPAQPPASVQLDPKVFITEGYSTAMNLVDETLKRLGFEKANGEKTTVAIERAFQKMKNAQNFDPDAQGLINAQKKEIAKYQKELEEIRDSSVNQMLLADLRTLSFDENYRDVTEKFLISELKNLKPELRDGKFVYKNEDGAVEYNILTGTPHTTESLIKSKYAKYLKESKELQAGSGAKIDGESTPKSSDKFSFDPSKIRNKADLIQYISNTLKDENGKAVVFGSPKFNDAYKEGVTSLNLIR